LKKQLKYILLITIFLLSFVLLIISAKLDSATTDEGVHLFAGFTYLTQKDFRLDPEHPPLVKEIAALPILFIHPNYTLNSDWQKAGNFYYDSWREARSMGDNFLYLWGNNADQLIFLGRIMMIFLTIALGLAVYFYAKKLYGEKAGIFAAFLTLFFPIILAHGRLINTDIGLTLFGLLTIYGWSNYLQSKNRQIMWKYLILCGLFLGFALSSKYTAIIFLPIMIVLGLIKIIIDKEKIKKPLLGFLGTLFIAFIVIWATYDFPLTPPPQPQGGLASAINVFATNQFTGSYDKIYDTARYFLIPSNFFKGLQLIANHVVGGNGSYLLGHNSITGWWYYFPIAIFFKTSIALFIFLGFSIYFFRKLKSKAIFEEYVLIITPLMFLFISMFSHANLGVRHVLPIFPYLIIFASKSINIFDIKVSKTAKYLFVLTFIWYLAVGVGSFPNFLAYFNEFSGGSKNGYRILTDSNLDWGQDIYRIKNYITNNNLGKVYMDYNWGGDAALNYYGIDYIPLKFTDKDVRGNIIISATAYNNDSYSWLQNYPKTEITPGVFYIEIK
jgi:hypothetical protein